MRAIDSVLLQTFEDFELIIVDDGSIDKTVEFISNITDSRIKYCKNLGRKGASGARNTGGKIANGKWLAFLDSDDTWKTDKLKKIYEYIKTQKYKAIYSGYDIVRNHSDYSVVDGYEGNHLQDLYFKNVIRGLSVFLIERSFFLEISGFDEEFQSKQDLDIYIRVSLKADIGYVPMPLVFIDTSPNFRISDSSKSRFEGWKSFYKKHKSLLPKEAKVQHLKSLIYYSLKVKNIKGLIRYGGEFVIAFFKT